MVKRLPTLTPEPGPGGEGVYLGGRHLLSFQTAQGGKNPLQGGGFHPKVCVVDY